MSRDSYYMPWPSPGPTLHHTLLDYCHFGAHRPYTGAPLDEVVTLPPAPTGVLDASLYQNHNRHTGPLSSNYTGANSLAAVSRQRAMAPTASGGAGLGTAVPIAGAGTTPADPSIANPNCWGGAALPRADALPGLAAAGQYQAPVPEGGWYMTNAVAASSRREGYNSNIDYCQSLDLPKPIIAPKVAGVYIPGVPLRPAK